MRDLEAERRAILESVAAGTTDPVEAAEQLAELDEPAASEEAGATGGTEASPPPAADVQHVRISATGHAVRVVADLAVRGAVAKGPHTARREGETLVLNADVGEAADFLVAGGPPWGRREHRWRWSPPMVVRMHPDLALTADVTAGSLAVRGIRGPLTLAVSAGSVTVSDFAAPIDIEVSAGSVSASGVLDRGESRVRCNAGSVKLSLDRGSSVRVRGLASAGRLVLPHPVEAAGAGRRRAWVLDQHQETVIGDGRGALDVEVTTGSVVVRSEG